MENNMEIIKLHLKESFIDLQKIKYEIRKVRSRKRNNVIYATTKRNEDKIILIINDKEVLEIRYKKGLEQILIGITYELERQIESRKRVISYLKAINNIVIDELEETIEDEDLDLYLWFEMIFW